MAILRGLFWFGLPVATILLTIVIVMSNRPGPSSSVELFESGRFLGNEDGHAAIRSAENSLGTALWLPSHVPPGYQLSVVDTGIPCGADPDHALQCALLVFKRNDGVGDSLGLAQSFGGSWAPLGLGEIGETAGQIGGRMVRVVSTPTSTSLFVQAEDRGVLATSGPAGPTADELLMFLASIPELATNPQQSNNGSR